ncbi:AfsR/SARP family transcriptional regulator [Micromonospora peucetia]|uniref:DNA-binding transcriptional activator of the SARP family n=1 Tax=Micromonospora peucetia TaxID=47871 RepID=A0A1C6VTU9_9ACTN|nr:BTAD domain-containing putative transcriptional regulator [Micromonospora peucetia]MCX4388227.1 AfsR/SARP family transcriptional regulator [Micromonospora peucetia]SCL69524.1 DNA-binding transcriptional activator of the SARP family [Micromonospora peucetia]
MKLQIRLLGSVELCVDDQVVTPGAAKRRAVLAGLALEANHSVSLSRLADMVWSDVPPASAVANLRSHAAALRRVLGDRLVARPNAYALRLSSYELDVTEFHRLVGEGRALLRTADPASAVGTLTAALAHWRGASGDGLPWGTALDNRWASLDEQRLQVFEELADARLAAGEHGHLLPELRGHLAAHPLRERAWAQLMLALYRCGDVPAALTVYRDARATLEEQLGIEPGEELVALHRAMLDRCSELAYTPPPAPVTTVPAPVAPAPGVAGSASPMVDIAGGVGWTVPRELPAGLVTFIGRGRETGEVVAALRGTGPTTVVVTGAFGTGKTALAVRAAHAVAADFPDGQVFVELGNRAPATSGEVLARVLRAIGVAPGDVPANTDERAGWFRSLVAGRRLLLVVDGVTRAAQVRPLLPAGPGPGLVVVGQRRLGSLDGVRRVTLRPLATADARDLLAALAGPERLAGDPVATGELLRLCAGSVLALRVAGTRLAARPGQSVAALVGQFADGRERLDLLDYEDLSVRASLDTAVAAVRADDEVAGRLLALLGATPDAVLQPERVARQLGISAARMRRTLDDLAEAHLVKAHRPGPGGHLLPALVREYAAELAAERTVVAPPLTARRVDPLVA